MANPYQRRAIQEMRDGKTYIYFIGGHRGPIKIGLSSAPLERLASMQICSPVELFLWAKVEGTFALEDEYHARFAEHRLHGEWFVRTPELRAEIKRLGTLCTNRED
jgi:hypothetical protein